MGWDGMGWDGTGWGGIGWDRMGWDGMGWDGMGWDWMGSDGVGWDVVGWDGGRAGMGSDGRLPDAINLHLLRLFLGLEQLWLEVSQLRLHGNHRRARLLKLHQPVVIPLPDEVDLAPLLAK